MDEQENTTAAKTATTPKAAAKKTTTKKAAVKNTATKTTASEKAKTTTTKAAAAESDNGNFKERAFSKAKSAAIQGKERTGSAIGGLSRMIEESAQTIDENVGEKYGNYARSAADSVANLADKLNNKEIDEIVEDARLFVRKSPGVAIGAAAVAGFLLSRLIKSGSGDRDA